MSTLSRPWTLSSVAELQQTQWDAYTVTFQGRVVLPWRKAGASHYISGILIF